MGVKQVGLKWAYTVTPEEVSRAEQYGDVTPNGVKFIDELVSINGCAFYLIKEAGITNEQITAAKRHLRNERDVVCFHIAIVDGEQEDD